MTVKKKRTPPAPAGRRVSKAELRRWMDSLEQIDWEASLIRRHVEILLAGIAKARGK